jgi:hypothetical protein
MLALFLGFSCGLNLSIDLGSFWVKSAIVRDSSPPEIALNSLSKSTTPCQVAFRAKPAFNQSLRIPITNDEIELLQVEI